MLIKVNLITFMTTQNLKSTPEHLGIVPTHPTSYKAHNTYMEGKTGQNTEK